MQKKRMILMLKLRHYRGTLIYIFAHSTDRKSMKKMKCSINGGPTSKLFWISCQNFVSFVLSWMPQYVSGTVPPAGNVSDAGRFTAGLSILNFFQYSLWPTRQLFKIMDLRTQLMELNCVFTKSTVYNDRMYKDTHGFASSIEIKQESRRTYGTAVNKVVIHLN